MTLLCYRCGGTLERLSLPLRRLDECPHCRVELHVCMMCQSYDPKVPRACTEDDAPDVRDKRSANFCDYFAPSAAAYRPDEHEAAARARAELDALFGGTGTAPPGGDAPADDHGPNDPDEAARRAAQSLFKGG
jgi:hypothetical protein